MSSGISWPWGESPTPIRNVVVKSLRHATFGRKHNNLLERMMGGTEHPLFVLKGVEKIEPTLKQKLIPQVFGAKKSE